MFYRFPYMDTPVLVYPQKQISALCGHWIPSRELTMRDENMDWYAEKSKRSTCCWLGLMMIMMMMVINSGFSWAKKPKALILENYLILKFYERKYKLWI